MGWTNASMDIYRICAIEQQQNAALFNLPTSIELNYETMRFFAGDEIVMNSNPLTRNQLVCSHIDRLVQWNAKRRADRAPEKRK